MNTFSHGIHPKQNKERTRNLPIAELPTPEVVYIPLSQHLGKAATPCVNKGDKVVVGQVIGKADGAISADIFSSVSGEVIAVADRDTVTGRCVHIAIKNDGAYAEQKLPPLTTPTSEQIVNRICECGIVGMGGAGFPTAVKLKPRDKIDTLIINAAECEPYLTCDYSILKEYTVQVLKGARYMAMALGLDEFTLGIEDNKSDLVELLQNTAKNEGIKANLVLCVTKYPQGAEKQLIYATTKRKVKTGKLPSDVGVIVSNAHTALSTYYAVEKGEKCYKRVVTVSGGAVKNPGNFWIRTGTEIKHVLDYCGAESDRAVKLLSGGPMMGFATFADRCVTKTTSGLLLLTKDETYYYNAEPCINCASCVKACPMKLMPVYIDSYILAGDVDGAAKYGAMNCIECGSCSYICPAHRPLVQSIRLAKKKIRERGVK